MRARAQTTVRLTEKLPDPLSNLDSGRVSMLRIVRRHKLLNEDNAISGRLILSLCGWVLVTLGFSNG
jgi:hypothetical protein